MATSVPITTNVVTVTDNGSTVDVAITSSPVTLDVGTTGPQGATGPAVPLSSSTPQPTGTAGAAGSGTSASKDDHVHALATHDHSSSTTGGAIPQSSVTDLVSSLAGKAPLASPTFTGTPTLPTGTIATTQSQGNNSTAVATTAYADTGLATRAATVGLWLSGTTGNYVSCPDAAAFAVTNLDARVRVALDDWTPAALTALFGCYGGSNRGWVLTVNTSGTLQLYYSDDGTNSRSNGPSSAATGFTDGAVKWVRVTQNTSTGATTYYTAADSISEPTSWTQLGTTVGGAALGLYNSTRALEVGSYNTGADGPAAGTFYRAILKASIGGASVADLDLTNGNGPRMRDAFNNLWTINGTANGWKR